MSIVKLEFIAIKGPFLRDIGAIGPAVRAAVDEAAKDMSRLTLVQADQTKATISQARANTALAIELKALAAAETEEAKTKGAVAAASANLAKVTTEEAKKKLLSAQASEVEAKEETAAARTKVANAQARLADTRSLESVSRARLADSRSAEVADRTLNRLTLRQSASAREVAQIQSNSFKLVTQNRQIAADVRIALIDRELAKETQATNRYMALGKERERIEAEVTASIESAASQRIAAENRQHRDESLFIRQNIADQKELERATLAALAVSERRFARMSPATARETIGGGVSTGAIIGGGAVLAGLTYAGIEAAKFSSSMTEMRNNTVMTEEEFKRFEQEAINIGKETGASVDGLGRSFMRAKNHSFDMAASIQIVREAAKSAVTTGSDVEMTANLLSQTMHIYHLNGDQAAATMETLHQAALLGNMDMSQFTQEFGFAEAVAAGFNLTLRDTAAVFSAMTENGLNAAIAGTQVRDVIQHIIKPSASARAELALLSKEFPELQQDFSLSGLQAKGLSGVLIDLGKVGPDAIMKLIPAQRGAFGAIVTAGKGLKDLTNAYEQLGLTMDGKLKPVEQGFALTQEQLDNKVKRLNNTLLELYVKYGAGVVNFLIMATDNTTKLIDTFNKLDPGARTAITACLGLMGTIALVGGVTWKTITAIKSMELLLESAKFYKGANALGAVATATEGIEASAPAAATGLSGLATILGTTFAAGTLGALLLGGAALAVGPLMIAAEGVKTDMEVNANSDYRNRREAEFQLTPNVNKNFKAAEGIRSSEEYRGLSDQFINPDTGRMNTVQSKALEEIARRKKANIAIAPGDETLLQNKARFDALNNSIHEQMVAGYATSGSPLHVIGKAGYPAPYAQKALSDAMTGTDPGFKEIKAANGKLVKVTNQCGEWLTKELKDTGINATATSLLMLARKNPLYREQSIGTDVNGDPLYHEGSLMFFKGTKKRQQHFGMYHVNDAGAGEFVSNTMAGTGKYHTAVQPFMDVVNKHGGIGNLEAYNAVGASGFKAKATPAQITPEDAAGAKLAKLDGMVTNLDYAITVALQGYSDTGDERYLHIAERKIALWKAARLKALHAKAQKDAIKNPATATQESLNAQSTVDREAADKLRGITSKLTSTPLEKEQLAAALKVSGLEAKKADLEASIAHLERAYVKTGDTGFLDQKAAETGHLGGIEDALLTASAAKEKIGNAGDKGGAKKKADDAIVDANLIAAIKKRHRDTDAAILDIQKQQNEAAIKAIEQQKTLLGIANQVLDAKLAAAKTEKERAPLRAEKYHHDLQGLFLQRAEDRGSLDPDIKKNADAKYASGRTILQLSHNQGEEASGNENIKRHADAIRLQADLATSIVEKQKLVIKYYGELAKQTGLTKEEKAAINLQGGKDIGEVTDQTNIYVAKTRIGSGIQSGNHQDVLGGVQDLINQSRDLHISDQDRAAGRADAISEVQSLTQHKDLSPEEALAFIATIRAADITDDEKLAAEAAALQIFDLIMSKRSLEIDHQRNPAVKQKMWSDFTAETAADPALASAGITKDALQKIDEKTKALHHEIVNLADDLVHAFTDAAVNGSGDFFDALLNHKGSSKAIQAFLNDIVHGAESGAVNLLKVWENRQLYGHNQETAPLGWIDTAKGWFNGGNGSNPALPPADGGNTGPGGLSMQQGEQSGGLSGAVNTASTAVSTVSTAATLAKTGGSAATSAASGGAFSSMAAIAPYAVAAEILSSPQVVAAITQYVQVATKATVAIMDATAKDISVVINGYATAISTVAQGIGKAVDSVGSGIQHVEEGAGHMFHSILSGITGADATRVQNMNVSKMDNVTIIQGGGIGGLVGGGGKGSILGTIGGFFGPVGAAIGGTLGKILHFKDGGDPPVGVPSIVGEQGIEVFIPKVAGTIIPNHKLGNYAVAAPNPPPDYVLSRPPTGAYDPPVPRVGGYGLPAQPSHQSTDAHALVPLMHQLIAAVKDRPDVNIDLKQINTGPHYFGGTQRDGQSFARNLENALQGVIP